MKKLETYPVWVLSALLVAGPADFSTLPPGVAGGTTLGWAVLRITRAR